MSFSQDKINALLKEGRDSPLEQKLRQELIRYIKASSEKMQTYWGNWEESQRKYYGKLRKDNEDIESRAKGEPEKVLIPVTFAQIQTAVSFIFGTFTQKEKFFEMQGEGPEDEKSVLALETDLDYQIRKSKAMLKLYSFLVDVFIYGVGVMKISWEEQRCLMRVAKQVPQSNPLSSLLSKFGLPAGEPKMKVEEAVQEVLKYEGNTITNIAPYCFFPDPSLPVARFQDGTFVAHEELVSRDFINQREGTLFHGTKHVKQFQKGSPEFDSRPRWFNREFNTPNQAKIDRNAVIFTEIQFTINPKEWNEKFQEAEISFGDEDGPVKFIAVIANDDKIIRFERLNYLHGNFTYVIGEYLPDHTQFLSQGMADAIDELQKLQTWFINSHIANVKKLIRNQVLVDPTKVHTEDFDAGKTVIRLKGGPSTEIDKVFKQLNMTDATRGHVEDADNMMSLIQMVTGVNENALGSYSSGRRSAYEARQVNAGASLRLKTHAMVIWLSAIEPLGQQLLANTRQSRSPELYAKIVGALSQEAPFEKTILADPDSIAGSYDFVPYDGTLPSEKQQFAQQLTEILQTILGNPNAQILGLDPYKILKQITVLYGMNNLDDFKLPPPMPMAMPGAVPGGAPIGAPPAAPPAVGPTGAPASNTGLIAPQ